MMFSAKTLLFTAASLLASTITVQAFGIGAPQPGTTIHPGQDVTVQIQVPVDTSAEAGELELALAIGVLSCPNSTCAVPSADLGELLYTGVFKSQGVLPGTLTSFENFTFQVPSDFPAGKASFQALRVSLATPPDHSLPGIEYADASVVAAA